METGDGGHATGLSPVQNRTLSCESPAPGTSSATPKNSVGPSDPRPYFDLTVAGLDSSSRRMSSFCFIMILFWSVRIRSALAISERDGLSHLNSFSLTASACFPLIIDPRRFSSLESSAKATRCLRSTLSDMLAAACSRLTSG